jgi:hypothetical protein
MRELIDSNTLDIQLNHGAESAYVTYIKERLYAWAEWYSQCNFFGIGFSSRTMEDRLMIEGAIIHSTAPKSFIQNKEAEEMEGYLNEMFLQERAMAIVLRWKCLFPSDSFRVQAEKLNAVGVNISHSSVQALLARAYSWLEGRMSANAKYNCLWVGSYDGSTVHVDKLWRNMDRYVH